MYPTKFGLNVSVSIQRDVENGFARVEVHAPMYKNKVWTMNHCYRAEDFTDAAILADYDFIKTLQQHYGVN